MVFVLDIRQGGNLRGLVMFHLADAGKRSSVDHYRT
jgi:hypothetical protein